MEPLLVGGDDAGYLEGKEDFQFRLRWNPPVIGGSAPLQIVFDEDIKEPQWSPRSIMGVNP